MKFVQDRDGDCDNVRRLKTELLVQIHKHITQESKGIYIIGCTNQPWIIKNDPAINRRFDKRIYIGLPSKNDRQNMFELFINQNNTDNNLSKQDYSTLSEITHRLSPADINGFVQDVLMEPIREFQTAKYFKRVYENDNDDYKLLPCDMNDDGAFKMSIMDCSDDNAQRVRPNQLNETFSKDF